MKVDEGEDAFIALAQAQDTYGVELYFCKNDAAQGTTCRLRSLKPFPPAIATTKHLKE